MATAVAMGLGIMFGASPEVSLLQRLVLAGIPPLITVLLVYLIYQSS